MKKGSSWISWAVLVLLLLVLGGLYYVGVRSVEGPVVVTTTETTEAPIYEKGAYEVTVREVAYYDAVRGFYAEPSVGGEFPGVVMIHEWWGLNDNIKEMAGNLASEGFRVLAVDLYHGEVATDAAEARELVSSVDQSEATANMQAALEYLKRQETSKVASFGWCFGGGQSLALALSGEKLDATVLYYGTPLVTDPARLSVIEWPVMGVFGDMDQSIPVATINEFEEALTEQGITREVYVYPGLGHAFANPTGQNYAPDETRDAWIKTVTFLKKHLSR